MTAGAGPNAARRRRRTDAELEQARGSGLRRVDFAWLLQQGIPGRLTAWASPGGFDLLMRDAVVFGRGHRFEFARLMRDAELDRVVAYTLLVRDASGAATDVAAWHPRTGRDPRAWLADERRGVVVVDERLARPELLDAGSIQAADIAHGEMLEHMLSKVRLPRIVIPLQAHRAVRQAA